MKELMEVIYEEDIIEKFNMNVEKRNKVPERIYYYKYTDEVHSIMNIINQLNYEPNMYEDIQVYVTAVTKTINEYRKEYTKETKQPK